MLSIKFSLVFLSFVHVLAAFFCNLDPFYMTFVNVDYQNSFEADCYLLLPLKFKVIFELSKGEQ